MKPRELQERLRGATITGVGSTSEGPDGDVITSVTLLLGDGGKLTIAAQFWPEHDRP